MNKPIFACLSAFALSLLFTSCKKNESAGLVNNSGYVTIPYLGDSLFATKAVVIDGPDFPGLDGGVLIANSQLRMLTDTAGVTDTYTTAWEEAYFNDSAQQTVSLNGTAIPLRQVVYRLNDTGNTWNENALNHWSVSGGGSVPAISQDVQGYFPSFSGALPATIDTNTNFSYTFSNTNVSNGDSAYVALYSNGNILRNDPVSAQNGTAMISSNQIKTAMKNTSLYIRNKLYYGGLLMVVIYRHEVVTVNNKQFVFVRQKQVLRTVNFN